MGRTISVERRKGGVLRERSAADTGRLPDSFVSKPQGFLQMCDLMRALAQFWLQRPSEPPPAYVG